MLKTVIQQILRLTKRYSDYGTVDGKVTFIGEKADVVEGIGKAVVVNVKITDKDFDKKIFSGLSGSADMVVNKRRIIEYFIDPITGALNESVREKQGDIYINFGANFQK